MPPGDRVGEAYVDIHVNAGPGEAELAAFKAKVDRDFAELARKKAEATLNLKKTDFDKQIHEAKGELDYFKMRRATATLDLAKKHFDKEIATAEAQLKALTDKKRTIQIDSRQVKAAHDAERLLAKERTLSERSALQQAKAEHRLSVERDRATDNVIKHRAEVARLSAEYEKLRGRQIGLEKSSRRVFSPNSIATAEKEARKLERVAAEADYVKHKIERLGGSVADLDPEIQRNNTVWGRWLSRLGDTSIRIGPLTTSFKGLGTGLALLGPLIFELGGGLTALAGTIGEGLVGAATVGAGALTGLTLSAAGVGFVIGPMIGEFKEVSAASEALHKAQLKYGKGSDEVATAQERLNHELHGVSPVAREAFQSLGGLKDQWKTLTKGARPAVFDAMGQSIKTAQALLPAFADESVKTTQVAGKAWEGWMKSLRSPEAKQILGNIMSDFRASIPDLASGFGSLIAMFGRLSAAGAHFLPSLSNGFAEWADNLERAVGGGKDLQSDVGGMVNQMRDFGHLTQHTGSLLTHIFDASADSGDGLVKSLDQVIQRWDKWTQTASGKRGLSEFFDDSQVATEDFMSSLGHLTKLLFEFSRATAPVANGLLQVVTWIGDLVSAADDLVGLKQVFQGVGIALAGLWVSSKVMSYADAIGTLATRLGLLRTASTAAAAASGGELVAGLGRSGAAATAATTRVGLFTSLLATPLVAPVALASMGFLIASLADSESQFEQAVTAFKAGSNEIPNALNHIAVASDNYTASLQRSGSVSESVAEARAHLMKVTNQGAPMSKQTAAVERLNAAERQQAAAIQARGHAAAVAVRADKDGLKAAKARLETAERTIEVAKKSSEGKGPKPSSVLGQGLAGAYRKEGQAAKEAAEGERERAQVMRELPGLERAVTLSRIPFERQAKNLAPLTHEAAEGLREMAKAQGQNVARKVGNFVDPKDIERVTTLSNRLTKLGRGGDVKNIAVKSQGADQTISKLQRLQKQTNRVEGARATIKVGANDTQAQTKLKRLSSLSQRLSGTKSTVRILANSSSAEQAIQRLRSHLTAVVTKQYKAELKAEDKSGAAANAFHHNVQRVSSQKYQARITAIDDASAKAKTAEGAGKRAAKNYKLNITATNSQALGAISSVQSALASLPSSKTVTVNVVTHKSGGFAGGPAVGYYSNFATGGINDRELQRANEQAVTRQSGPSRRVNRPTMLVGEQAPQHPEYVIATNPAFRSSNEQYLEDAAGDLGYEVIPAYKKGKGKKSSGKKGTAAKKGPGPHPPPINPKRHHYIPSDALVYSKRFNQLEKDAEIEEGHYGSELEHEEREIAAGRMNEWNFGLLRKYKTAVMRDYETIRSPVLPEVVKQINAQKNTASKTVKGIRKELSHVGGTLGSLEHDYSAMEKNKNESTKDFNAKKRAKKFTINEWKKRQKKLKEERDAALKIIKEAKEQLHELKTETEPQLKDSLLETGGDLQELTDIETGVIDAPYSEAAGESSEMESARAGLIKAEIERNTGNEEAARKQMVEIAEREYNAALGTPNVADDIEKGEQLKQLREESLTNGGQGTIGEQTASLSEARENLYKDFASNITGTGVQFRGVSPDTSIYSAASQPAGTPNYTPAAITKAVSQSSAALASLTQGGGTGTVNEVNNYFAAPPPDPHTWTRQQAFELANL